MLLLALGPRSACDRTSDEEECLSRHWATMGEWTVSDLGFGFRNGAAKAGSPQSPARVVGRLATPAKDSGAVGQKTVVVIEGSVACGFSRDRKQRTRRD